MTFVRPTGWSESRPFAEASAPAKSWPGTTERSGDRSGDGAAGTGRRYAAPSISECALPLATSVAPASRARLGGFDDRWQGLVPRGDRPDGEQRIECGDRAVREVGRGQWLGGDAAGLGQLERDLARGGELDSAADHVHAANVCERARDRCRRRPRSRGAPRPWTRLSGRSGRRSRPLCPRPRPRAAGSRRAGSRTSSRRRPRARARRRAGASDRLRARARSRSRSSRRS